MSGTTLWVTLVVIGLLTVGIRLSFILLLERWKPPLILERSLRFVPAAVLSAIILPEMVLRNNALDVSFGNARLLAGLLAGVVAWRTRNALLTIVVGMLALLILQALI